MRNDPRYAYRTHDPHENYTLEGLLAYAAVVPALVVLLAAPVLVLTMVVGFITACGVSRLRDGVR
ncbi:hypothetical protein DP107_05970 [Haloglomus irregulare]|jgi:hypothetical protein|uniref:Uncharacterized protein n=1 Tax=Haloglomus irregulare TaxID=2234134 RepID=A0A554NDB7_9EURY|nr:hypothetical protein [Haloglomus irregulare]TSD15387.1 hypothetical protein DP107_05970 [Haloglomus irregulare]